MKIFAIGDLHLSFGETVEKPMDIFGGQWIGHTEKLYKSWHEKISDEDILRILGNKGIVKVFSESYKPFTTGKSDISENEERLFLCKVSN